MMQSPRKIAEFEVPGGMARKPYFVLGDPQPQSLIDFARENGCSPAARRLIYTLIVAHADALTDQAYMILAHAHKYLWNAEKTGGHT